ALIDERNRYAELTLDRLIYAEQWGTHLVLAGAGGIFDFDSEKHSWRRPATETITTVGRCAAAPCFYYGYSRRSGGVGLFTAKTLAGEPPRRWQLPGEQPARIAASPSGQLAVLTTSGRAYALSPGTLPLTIQPATSAVLPPDRFD